MAIKKILRLTILIAVPGCAALVGCTYYAYPGFVGDFVADLRYASPSEIKAKYSFFYYYASFYERLKVNPATGMYDMAAAVREYENQPGRSDLELAKLNFHQGDFAAAVRGIEADIAKHGESEERLFWLAMSYLRLAETENCLARVKAGAPHEGHHGDVPDPTRSCSLPITIFQDKRASTEAAARAFKKLLDDYDRENRLYRWLLNFCYMTIDRFPDGVPQEYLIKSDFIDSFYGAKKRETEARFGYLSFRDRARELGVATLDAGKGVAVEDFDNDGDLDIVTGGTFSGTVFYRNEGGGRGFTDRTREAGLGAATQPYMISAADYDNDGRMDLFIGRPFQRFILYHNEGGGTFKDVTISSGLLPGEPSADEAIYTCASAWADVDNDGDLDLFIAQFGQRLPWVGGLLARRPMSSRLFINEGGRFTDRTDEYGLGPVVNDMIFVGAAFGDYDADGWPDLFLSSVSRTRSVLLHNVGGQRFERTNLIGGEEPGFTAAFVDVNQDGQLDIFQGSQGIAASDTARAVFGVNPIRNNNRIFLQEGGRFSVRPDLFGGAMSVGTMGSSYGDINNDGCPDFYLGTKTPESWNILPNLMYVGETEGTRCTGRLANVTMLDGFGTVQKGHGIVFFDFDDDGDEDIYSSLGGMWPGDEWPNQLFVNESRLGGAWLKVRLRGRRTNRFGVGARIKVVAEGANGEEIVRFYQMDEKTGFGSAPYLAHVGLMGAKRVREIQVFWPASHQTRSYAGTLRTLNVLDEGEGTAVDEGAAPAAGAPHGGER